MPVKWGFTDAAGYAVSDPTGFVSLTNSNLDCETLAGVYESNVETCAGSSGPQYPGGRQVAAQTEYAEMHANTRREMRLKLKDGSIYTANLKFKE